MRLKNVDEAMELFKKNKGTVFNFVFADVEGNIGFTAPGGVPIRKHPYHGSKGIQEGFSGEDEWEGFRVASKNPHLVNPRKGYIVTANNMQGGPHAVFGTTAASTA